MTDQTIWPAGFCDGLAGKTFEWTIINKPDWVDFTINEMKDVTGFFKIWKDYLLNHNAEKSKTQLRSTTSQNRAAD
jgi:hypothetical protein